jgi:serine protease inhibitor
MAYADARNKTEVQMSKVLHFDLNQVNTHQGLSAINKTLNKTQADVSIKLAVANTIWKDQSISREMGMPDAFSHKADFSGIIAQEVFISLIKHKAFIDVNEKGSEAAASTAVLMTRSCGSSGFKHSR